MGSGRPDTLVGRGGPSQQERDKSVPYGQAAPTFLSATVSVSSDERILDPSTQFDDSIAHYTTLPRGRG